MKHHEDEQITVIDLVNKMKDICGDEAYSSVHMKKKLKEHFGNEIIITDVSGKSSVITLRDTATSIIQNFYNRPKFQDSEAEKDQLSKPPQNL